jgi:speckle-type POZ protein
VYVLIPLYVQEASSSSQASRRIAGIRFGSADTCSCARRGTMADNNNDAVDNNVAAAADDEEDDIEEEVETKIERLKSDNPKERLFSVTFDNFEDLPSEKGQEVVSSEFSCFGAQWRISIYPGGHKESSDGMVSLFLQRCSEGRKKAIKYSLVVAKGDEDQRIQRFEYVFDDLNGWGWHDFCLRKEIIRSVNYSEGYLEEGALTIHVRMALNEFTPKNPASSIMLKLFDDENSADVVFEICEQQKESENSTSNGRKRAKTSAAKLYHAHRLILQHCSQELSALCATSDGSTPIIINDVKPEVFRHLLYYVYGGEITDEEFVGHERDLINAADKYGVTNLKLEAEVWYVNNKDITIDNVIDTLLYAHAMNCALLKESVMDFIVEHKEKVQRVSFQDVPGDVCKDLLAAMSRTSGDDDEDDLDDDSELDVEKMYMKMRIRDLRQKLHVKGLDTDGSREALIAKLKEHP